MRLKGLDEFLELFGDVTISDVVYFLLACVFAYFVYTKVRDYFVNKHEREKEKDAQLQEALTAVRKYPEYRQQSIKIQELLEGEIQELRAMQEENAKSLKDNAEHLKQIEEQNQRRERNKLRDRLLQNYRYYTNVKTNPSQSWTQMEAEAFWELFRDYEDAGGDGYMHSEVQPAMERLTVTEHNN